MASWENYFKEGVLAFRASKYEISLIYFDEAIEKGGERYNVYDSRAATLEKLGKIKQALKDSRRVIELAPAMCHGYARSARLFLKLERYSVALDMIRWALERVPTHSPARRMELEALHRTILQERDAEALRNPPKTPFFSKFPVELISQVFLFAVEEDSAFPVLACHVCSHWRAISLSMPILWEHVTLSHRAPVKKLALWLERSKNRITGLRIRYSLSRLRLREALAVCNPESFNSLKSIYCEGDVLPLTSWLLRIPGVHNLNLEDIHLSFPEHHLVDTIYPLVPLVPLDRMSTVRSLTMIYATANWSIVTPRLSHLRILVIRTKCQGIPMTDQLYGLLSANPHLEKLVLETNFAMEVGHLKSNSRIALSHLAHLELLGPMKAGILVAHLFLPVLERFSISRCLSDADQVMSALEPLPMAIAELSLQRCYFDPKRLTYFLKTMTQLTKLEITHTMDEIDVVVDAVAGSQQVAGEMKLVCPWLKHVNFSHCTRLHSGSLMGLVRPRLIENNHALSSAFHTSTSAKIESIHIDGCPNIDPSGLEWLRSQVSRVSCIYMTKEEARRIRQ